MYSMIPCHAMNPDCGKFQGKNDSFLNKSAEAWEKNKKEKKKKNREGNLLMKRENKNINQLQCTHLVWILNHITDYKYKH